MDEQEISALIQHFGNAVSAAMGETCSDYQTHMDLGCAALEAAGIDWGADEEISDVRNSCGDGVELAAFMLGRALTWGIGRDFGFND